MHHVHPSLRFDPRFDAAFQRARRDENAGRAFLHERWLGLTRLHLISLKADVEALRQDLIARRKPANPAPLTGASSPSRKYSPDQPRRPGGQSGGGQWTSGGGVGEASSQPLTIGSRTDGDIAANDGTPRSNQAQNKQVDDVVRILRLTPDERRQLHMEISGQNFGFQEILRIGREIKGQ